MDLTIQQRIQKWLDGPYDECVKEEIRHFLKEKPDVLMDAFYRDLSFGTGGLRGIMGIGTNRMNIYTVRIATQGLSSYLFAQKSPMKRVFIGYDVRLNSRLFAEESARVLAGNGIEVYITKQVCPTPLASYACRMIHCSAAIMITASHNPSQYNGYKVFWSDGAQVVFPHDAGIISEVQRIQTPDQVHLAPLDHPLIHWVGDEIDQAYLNELDQLFPSPCQSTLRLIYTNLHGTGLRLVPPALRRAGFSCISLVLTQQPLDGHFPAAPSPNPEEETAMALGSRQLIDEEADLLLATDPDADRLGVVVRHHGQAVRLNGNDIASICLDHLASSLQPQDQLPPNGAIIKTIVSSELVRKIAKNFGIECYDVLTGFKYIAKQIRDWETAPGSPKFLFGAEESHGYLIGTFVRDKDAISAARLVCNAAEKARQKRRTLIDRLYDLFRIYGVHRQSLTVLKFADSASGIEMIQSLMDQLRQNPPLSIHGHTVIRLDDYSRQVSIDQRTNQSSPLMLPVSDVLSFWLEDESRLVIRPSGTEPRIKIYAEVSEQPTDLIEKSIARCDEKIADLLITFQKDRFANILSRT
jgi:phosphomannomutase